MKNMKFASLFFQDRNPIKKTPNWVIGGGRAVLVVFFLILLTPALAGIPILGGFIFIGYAIFFGEPKSWFGYDCYLSARTCPPTPLWLTLLSFVLLAAVAFAIGGLIGSMWDKPKGK